MLWKDLLLPIIVMFLFQQLLSSSIGQLVSQPDIEFHDWVQRILELLPSSQLIKLSSIVRGILVFPYNLQLKIDVPFLLNNRKYPWHSEKLEMDPTNFLHQNPIEHPQVMFFQEQHPVDSLLIFLQLPQVLGAHLVHFFHLFPRFLQAVFKYLFEHLKFT